LSELIVFKVIEAFILLVFCVKNVFLFTPE
jgi:hypothetical protein